MRERRERGGREERKRFVLNDPVALMSHSGKKITEIALTSYLQASEQVVK